MRLRNIKRQQARKARPKRPVPPELRTHTRYSAGKTIAQIGSPQSRFEADQKTMRRCGICGKSHRDCGCAELLEALNER